MLCHLFLEIRILLFFSEFIMNRRSKSPFSSGPEISVEQNFDASFPMNKRLLQRTNRCLNCPVQLFEPILLRQNYFFHHHQYLNQGALHPHFHC